MKYLICLVGLWLMAAIGAGGLGHTWLQGRWRSASEAAFRRDVEVSRAILQGRQWQLPLEADSRWAEMERMLDLDAAPHRPRTHGTEPQAAAPVDAEDGGGKILWVQSATGQPRLLTHSTALIAETESSGADEPYSLRFTRELPSSDLQVGWWSLWIGCNLFGAVFALAMLRAHQARTREQQAILTPWLDATQATRGSEVQRDQILLPPIVDHASELEPPLSLIAERINRLVASLENSNERSELVLGNLQEGVLAVDDGPRILLANNALRRLLELPDDHYLYRPLLEVVRIPVVAQLVEYVLEENVPREAVLALGEPPRSLRLLAHPLPLDNNRRGALLTVRDETLLKRIESVRRDFVANASHELKTPLAAIRAYAETLQMGALDDREAAEQFVGNIIEQADRINGLVQGMLQLSRVQAGTALQITAFDTAQALQPCLAAAEAMARGKGVIVHSDLPQSPLWIRSDRDGFQTIASNLLSNAVRYTPEGGSVALSTREDEEWFVLTVSDTGIGICQDDLERVFERFYRAEKHRSSDTGGTGLGLSIVKHLVHALDGRVLANSQPAVGSRFEVWLPRRRR